MAVACVVRQGKVLRLRFPEEVLSESGTAKRSATTGVRRLESCCVRVVRNIGKRLRL